MRQKSIKQLPLLDGNGQLIGVETFDELIEAPHYPNPVLIMAGGLGERLGALTRERPKPMLNVGGRPLLETIIRNVVQQGFQEHLHLGELPGRNDRGAFRRRLRARRRDPVCP